MCALWFMVARLRGAIGSADESFSFIKHILLREKNQSNCKTYIYAHCTESCINENMQNFAVVIWPLA